VIPSVWSVVLFPIQDQFVHILLSEHSDLFDFDIVLNVERSPEINPTPWVQLLRVIHEFNAKRFFV